MPNARTAMIIAMGVIGAQAAMAQQPPAAPPDPAKMTRPDLERELGTARALVANGAVVAQRPAGCTTPEQRGFDFWLGEWDVSSSGTSALVAESSITLGDQGCVILETWRPFQGASGHSINAYDTVARHWTQTWADATGRVTRYEGPVTDGTLAMEVVASAPPGNPKFAKSRMSFRAIDANTVRQWGAGYDAAKQAWVVTWDLTYRRRAGTKP